MMLFLLECGRKTGGQKLPGKEKESLGYRVRFWMEARINLEDVAQDLHIERREGYRTAAPLAKAAIDKAI